MLEKPFKTKQAATYVYLISVMDAWPATLPIRYAYSQGDHDGQPDHAMII